MGGFLTADQLVFNPTATNAFSETDADLATYFSNAVDSTRTGVDITLSYQTTIAEGDFSETFAANINDTEIDNVNFLLLCLQNEILQR